ncbi:MAG: hypothetical protein ACFFD2_09290, partial [Promethearchaeota archaeon]
TAKMLEESGISGLTRQISDHYGGFNKVRERLGYEIERKSPGYWQEWENVKEELQHLITEEFDGKFPTVTMLEEAGFSSLSHAICEHYGGFNAVRKIMGYEIPNWSERASYYAKRGYTTEIIVKEILTEFADINEFPYSDSAQTKVGPGRFLEMVCGENKKYGIDITNSKTIESVERKWKRKKYHKHVDELWVVVVSNKFKKEQFEKWNEESPDNVLVIDYRKLEKFLNSFTDNNVPFKIPTGKRRKLEALARCTFLNKEKIKKKLKSGKKFDPQRHIEEY